MRFYQTRWFIALVLFTVLTVVVGGISLSSLIQSEWRLMLDTGAAIEQRIDAELAAARPVLHDDPIEGQAWGEYEHAIGLVPATSHDDWLAYMKILRAGKTDNAKRDALIAAHAPALAAMMRGARHTHATYPTLWHKGFSHHTQNLLTTRSLVNVANIVVRKHAEDGNFDLAIDQALASMQFGGDLMRAPLLITQMIGCAVTAIATKESLLDDGPRGPALISQFQSEQLERLAAAMRILDEGLGSERVAFDGEIAFFVRSMHDDLPGAEAFTSGGLPMLAAWRYYFSMRLMCADHVRVTAEWNAQHRLIEDGPWADRRRLLAEELLDAKNSPNMIRTVCTPNLHSAVKSYLDTVLRLRFARMAVDERLGRMKPLADPYGKEISIKKRVGGRTLWSLGPDGTPNPKAHSHEIDDRPAASGR